MAKKKITSRGKRGHYLSDDQLENGETPRARVLEAGRKKKVRQAAARRKTERTFLRRFVQGMTLDDVDTIREKVIQMARKGDKDAWAWLGKYVFGNGKTSLIDVARPPMIRRTRG